MIAEHNSPKVYALCLLGLYLLWWSLLAIAPWYRADWLLENVLVLIGLPIIVAVYQRLSRVALTALFVFFLLHAVGAHYTYEKVPYDAWAQLLPGHPISDWFGFERNHFDRLVHFLYGLLVTPAMTELLDSRVTQRGGWRYLVPFSFVAAQAALYEIIEWGAAGVFGGELGQAYLGTQGDAWDSQKDSALVLAGALIAVIYMRRRPQKQA